MEIKDIRKRNAQYWMDSVGRGALAEKMGYKDTVYLNQIYIGTSNVGTRTARKFEKALELNRGWMDAPHPDLWTLDQEQATSAQLRQAISLMLDGLSPEGLQYTYHKVKGIAEQDRPSENDTPLEPLDQ